MNDGKNNDPGRDGNGLYIAMISIHGLARGDNIELGRDSDTGGQISYVIELVRALSEHPDVDRVDLFTRRIEDPRVDDSYARCEEQLAERAWLIRVPGGPRQYLRKEVLWPCIDEFVDEIIKHFKRIDRLPSVIHGHYADAGLIGAKLSNVLGIPLVFTGHSLGRVKRQRLIDKGMKEQTIEDRYNISTRIEAEEVALETAQLVVTSTRQEMNEQYSQYGRFDPRRARVIPPGVDLDRFRPPERGEEKPAIFNEISRFLRHPDRPMILAISRADERKNIGTLVEAFAGNSSLRDKANLVLFLGNRDRISDLDKGPKTVLTRLLLDIDDRDLYGVVAIPKHNTPEDVPGIYRAAAATRGVFVNPALTEPFGLTLIEAAASGLPLVATSDGGPSEIIGNCRNGLLIDPLDAGAIGDAILKAISDRERHRKWSRNGIRTSRQLYSWAGHVETYVGALKQMRKKTRRTFDSLRRNRLPAAGKMIVTDLDGTLLGNQQDVDNLVRTVQNADPAVAFGIATGRRLESALAVLKKWNVPLPDVLITSVGTEIHYRTGRGNRPVIEDAWSRHINHRWQPERIRAALSELDGLRPQPDRDQREFKISYFLDSRDGPGRATIVRHLRKKGLAAHVIVSMDRFVDVLPLRASKGTALHFLLMRWGLSMKNVLVAGDSGNDEEMLRLNTPAVVVGNASPDLDVLRNHPRVFFASRNYAGGILEAIDHFDFLADESDAGGDDGPCA